MLSRGAGITGCFHGSPRHGDLAIVGVGRGSVGDWEGGAALVIGSDVGR